MVEVGLDEKLFEYELKTLEEKEEIKEKIYRLWMKTKEEIKQKIDELLKDEEHQFSYYIKENTKGGKMFRPFICVMVADCLSNNDKKVHETALRFGAVIEFIHNATLIHDDIIDIDYTRRNLKSVWLVVKEKVSKISGAILLGDQLIAKALYLVKSPTAMKIVTKGIDLLVKGAIIELTTPKDLMDLLKYKKISVMKTAALFATASALGAVAATKDKKIINRARKYGKYLGIAFQIADDILDNDLPKNYSVDDAKKDIKLYIEKAKKEIDVFPDNIYKKILLHIPDFVIEKKFEIGT